jgi:hypothetical protein
VGDGVTGAEESKIVETVGVERWKIVVTVEEWIVVTDRMKSGKLR